jgi:predicted ATP-dependent endonuclease of OLD family
VPKIRHIEVLNFRSIKELSWFPNPGGNCLIGPGDSGKTTILDAIDACLSIRKSMDFCDADFHELDVENPIVVRVTLGALPEHLMDLDAYGEVLRAFDEKTQAIAFSAPNWTASPRQTGHPFHGKLDTWSSANWTPIPLQTGQFEAA